MVLNRLRNQLLCSDQPEELPEVLRAFQSLIIIMGIKIKQSTPWKTLNVLTHAPKQKLKRLILEALISCLDCCLPINQY